MTIVLLFCTFVGGMHPSFFCFLNHKDLREVTQRGTEFISKISGGGVYES